MSMSVLAERFLSSLEDGSASRDDGRLLRGADLERASLDELDACEDLLVQHFETLTKGSRASPAPFSGLEVPALVTLLGLTASRLERTDAAGARRILERSLRVTPGITRGLLQDSRFRLLHCIATGGVDEFHGVDLSRSEVDPAPLARVLADAVRKHQGLASASTTANVNPQDDSNTWAWLKWSNAAEAAASELSLVFAAECYATGGLAAGRARQPVVAASLFAKALEQLAPRASTTREDRSANRIRDARIIFNAAVSSLQAGDPRTSAELFALVRERLLEGAGPAAPPRGVPLVIRGAEVAGEEDASDLEASSRIGEFKARSELPDADIERLCEDLLETSSHRVVLVERSKYYLRLGTMGSTARAARDSRTLISMSYEELTELSSQAMRMDAGLVLAQALWVLGSYAEVLATIREILLPLAPRGSESETLLRLNARVIEDILVRTGAASGVAAQRGSETSASTVAESSPKRLRMESV